MKRSSSPIDLDYVRPTFWSKVRAGDQAECWPWLQSTGSHGYGQTWDKKTVRLAHRVAWELTYGRIPEGLTVDHACRNRPCCNPAHMRLLPNVVNATMNGNWAKTHCLRGHEFNSLNTFWTSLGHRGCRTCRTLRKRGQF